MAKQETKTEKIEREYIIPLRREFHKVTRHKRSNKAISAIKKFLVRHMKIRDRDTSKIRIDRYLNEEIWHRGIKNPPARIKVKAIKEGDIVRVELFEMHEKLKFKKAREEKVDKKGTEVAKKKKEAKAEETESTEEKTKEEIKEDTEQKKEEQKEKEGATEQAMEDIAKQTAKVSKHESVSKVRQPKHQFRQALQK